MEGFWSLTFFTVLGQAAAGMAILKAVFSDKSKAIVPLWVLVAGILLGIATAMSLLHLSVPTSAYYSIINLDTSWLSREILTVGLFGGLLLAYLFIRKPWMRYVVALAALLMIYAMARVYMLQTVMAWDTYLTFATFLTTSILLGATMLFIVDLMACRKDILERKAILYGWRPIVIACALSVQLVLASWQSILPDANIQSDFFIGQYILLLAGTVLGFIAFLRSATLPENTENTMCFCRIIALFWLALLLIWAGAVCGRVLFYSSYTYFGM